jgi:hypothetical protein
MTISTGARVGAGYITEVTFGTTPATPQLIDLPFTSFSLNLSKEEFADNTARADRMNRWSLSGNRSVGGSIDVNLNCAATNGHHDALMESLMQSAWATNILKVGTTRKSLTIEEAQFDVSQFRVFTGVVVDKATFTFPTSGPVTAKFDVLAKDQSAMAAATIDTSAGYTASQVALPFTDVGTSGFFKEGGTAIPGVITAMSLEVNNGYEKNIGLGSNLIRDFTTGKCEVSGTATVFFEDAVLYNKFANGTASSIDVKLDNGTSTLQITVPNVKWTEASKTLTAQGTITMSMKFVGLYDATSNSNVVFTRT